MAIARALVMEPEVLLLDEITSALDPELSGEVLDVMEKLAKERAITIISGILGNLVHFSHSFISYINML